MSCLSNPILDADTKLNSHSGIFNLALKSDIPAVETNGLFADMPSCADITRIETE